MDRKINMNFKNAEITKGVIIVNSPIENIGGIKINHSEQETTLKRKFDETGGTAFSDLTQNYLAPHTEEINFAYKLAFHNFNESFFKNLKTNFFKSRDFYPPNRNEPKVNIELWLKGEDQNCDFISIFLHFLFENYREEITFLYKMSIIDRENQEWNTKDGDIKLCKQDKVGWQEYISHDELVKQAHIILNQNILTLNCKINYDQEVLSMMNNRYLLEGVSKTDKLSANNYSRYWKNSEMTDLKILIGETEFEVHKFILGDRAPEFKKVHNIMQHSKENPLTITDIDANVFKEFLRFIYKSEAHFVDEFSSNLFALSKKYKLDDLKYYCEKILCTKLLNDTVCDLLIFAKEHEATYLKTEAIEYFNVNCQVIEGLESYHLFKKSPHAGSLLSDIFFARVRKHDPYLDIVHIK